MTEKDLDLMSKAYAGGKQPKGTGTPVVFTPEEIRDFLEDDGE